MGTRRTFGDTLHFCAAPRANRLLRTLPPALVAECAGLHDRALWQTLLRCLGEDLGGASDRPVARAVANLTCAGPKQSPARPWD